MRCFCGCGRRAVQQHHVIYEQELRRLWRAGVERRPVRFVRLEGWAKWKDLQRDPRNLVWVARDCHDGHHRRSHPYAVSVLPEAVFDFARELMNAGPAYEYLARRYGGSDERLEALRLEADGALADA